MILVYTSDLHGIKDLYVELFELAERKRANAVIIGGDMLPKQGPLQFSLQEQQKFIDDFLAPQLKIFLSRLAHTKFYVMLGNDDWNASLAPLKRLSEKKMLRLMHAKKHDLTPGFEIIGYSHVPPTPFTIKDHERRDLEGDVVISQRGTACCSDTAKIFVVESVQYFASQKSIEEELRQLPEPENPNRCVYVMHAPPFKTGLDRMEDGRSIGSRAVRSFIEMRQPYLTLHGHIHESLEMSGIFQTQIGKTICINPGQSTEELYAVVFELENVSGTIAHTVFGRKPQLFMDRDIHAEKK